MVDRTSARAALIVTFLLAACGGSGNSTQPMPSLPDGWKRVEMKNLGLSGALPEDWLVMPPKEGIPEKYIDWGLDHAAQIVRYKVHSALYESVISPIGYVALDESPAAFAVALALAPGNANPKDAVDIALPIGSARLGESRDGGAQLVVPVAKDWSLAITARLAADHPDGPADAFLRRLGATLVEVGPPATTDGALPSPGPGDLPRDIELEAWIPDELAEREVIVQAPTGRGLMLQSMLVEQALGSGTVFDVCLAFASNADDVSFALGSTRGGDFGGFFGCRVRGATNDDWVAAMPGQMRRDDVAGRPSWTYENSAGYFVRIVAAGEVAVQVYGKTSDLVDSIVADLPDDLAGS